MDMTGQRHIPAPRARVWDALQDPGVLRRAIPGCKTLERATDTAFKGMVGARIGPVATDFALDIKLFDLDPPQSYRIESVGHGGAAGFVRGGASLALAEDGVFTRLTYTVNAEVGGRLAQVGARLIETGARQMADRFFDLLTAEVAAPVSSAADGAAGLLDALVHPAAEPSTGHGEAPTLPGLLASIPREPLGFPLVAWVGGAAWAIIFVMLFSAYL
jgi:carbon monoxide dehydrogenase subunit G